MAEKSNYPLLEKPIQGLNLSPEFKVMAKSNGYKTLQDILKTPLQELPFKKDSGYRMLKELLDVLKNNGLETLIKDW